MKKLLIAIVIPYLITGCATTYHQKNIFGGYSDQKFEKDIYQVGFDASLVTDKDMIEQFIQYRSAEIVIEQGYQFYAIIDNYTPAHSITIRIYEERPENIEVRDANEVIANLKENVHQAGMISTIALAVPEPVYYLLGGATIYFILCGDNSTSPNGLLGC